jgi:erythronate-4-phosphate dehydrogenase
VGYYCNKLGLKVIVNDPPLYDNNHDFPEYVTHSALLDLLTHCNIITNHVPLSFEGKYKTRLLIGEREFEKIMPETLFIHTSRGGVVDEISLLTKFLKRDLTYVVDVFENEPDISKDVVENAMIATPHIAGYSFEGKRRGALMMAKALAEKFNLNLDYSLFENEISSGSITIDYSDHLNLFKILDYSRKLMHTFNDLKETLEFFKPKKSISFDLLRKKYFECRETLHV